jgi:hypothetical protein
MDRFMDDELLQYLDGKDTEYESIINSLRGFLCTLPELNDSVGGAFIFFRPNKNNDADNLTMKVFPFNKNLPFLKTEFLTQEQKVTILKKIGESKLYSDFWHYNLFINNSNSRNHFGFQIREEDVLKYADMEKEEWVTLYEGIVNNTINKNKYEQLLFESGCDNLTFIPIPVLSTPSILVVLNHDYVANNWSRVLESVYFRAREPISTYIDMRLSKNIKLFIEDRADQITEEELVIEYVKQISHVLLPISYQINDNPIVTYYKNWPEPETPSTYEINLLDGRYKVVYTLTSFHYLNFQAPNSHTFQSIHNSIGCDKDGMFQSNLKSSSDKTAIRFMVLHAYWKHLKDIKEKANAELRNTVNELFTCYVTPARDAVTNLEMKLKDLQSEGISFRETKHSFIVKPDFICLAAKGQIFYKMNEEQISKKGGPKPNQRQGLIYIHYIISEAKKKKNFSISAENLFDSCSQNEDLSNWDSMCIKQKKSKNLDGLLLTEESLKNDLQSWVEEFSNDIKNFNIKYAEQLVQCLDIDNFKDFFYNLNLCHKQIIKIENANFKINDYMKSDILSYKQYGHSSRIIKKAFQDYKANEMKESEGFKKFMEVHVDEKIRVLSNLLKKPQNIKVEKVRVSVEAAIQLIFKRSSEAGENGLSEILKNHFQKSGFYDDDNDKSKDGMYKYNNSGDWYIDWVLE